jgi:F-type H+-transporting ATPase subunit alpha
MINSILKDNQFTFSKSFKDLGVIISIMDSIALIYGLFNSFMGEMIEIKAKLNTAAGEKKIKPLYGMVLNLGRSFTNVVIFGNATSGFQGSEVTRTKQLMSIPITRAGLMGRVIDSLGNPIDNSLDSNN